MPSEYTHRRAHTLTHSLTHTQKLFDYLNIAAKLSPSSILKLSDTVAMETE